MSWRRDVGLRPASKKGGRALCGIQAAALRRARRVGVVWRNVLLVAHITFIVGEVS